MEENKRNHTHIKCNSPTTASRIPVKTISSKTTKNNNAPEKVHPPSSTSKCRAKRHRENLHIHRGRDVATTTKPNPIPDLSRCKWYKTIFLKSKKIILQMTSIRYKYIHTQEHKYLGEHIHMCTLLGA